MYQKYSTDALVLGSREQGEADKVFALYTRDFGLVWARASAVRGESSKMRAALQSCSRARVSLVRGKRGWRLAGAAAELSAVGKTGQGISSIARIAELVLRLVRGEERNEYLFSALSDAQEALLAPEAEHASIEIVCVARVLYALGYLSAEALETTLFAHTAYGLPELEEAGKKRAAFLASINRAISETQL
jgi:recombinational DNA repair protein (RecF pathway)